MIDPNTRTDYNKMKKLIQLDKLDGNRKGVLRKITEEGQIITNLITTFPAKADKQKKKQIRDLVKKYKIGGLLFAEGTPEEQAILTNIAQKNSKVPVMITFDGEWGLSMRLEGTPYFPKNAALGCIEDNQLIYEYGREVAREFS